MSKRKKEELPDYTVADMNIEGMPWNSRRPWQILPGDPGKRNRSKTMETRLNAGAGENCFREEAGNPFLKQEQMAPAERRMVIWLALKASLGVALVFGGAALVFLLFCVFVWFR